MPFLFIVASPSGAGKSTLCRHLREKFSDIDESISVTTRKPRHNEINHVNYHFVSKEEYDKLVLSGAFLEHALFCGNYYGTLKSEVENIFQKGKNVLFDIDVQGVEQIKKRNEFIVKTVFIMPPSFEVLERRLRNRRSDAESDIQMRLERAKIEMTYQNSYDHVIINDDLERAKMEIEEIYINASK